MEDIDLFGSPILVNFQGKTHFKTVRGGLISCLIYVFTLVQTVTLSRRLILQEDPIISSYQLTGLQKVNEEYSKLVELGQVPSILLFKP